jgi:predicted bacteriocin transport accessory protein
MNETKKSIILFGTIGLIIVLLIGLSVVDNIEKEKSVKEYFSYFKTSESFKDEDYKILVFEKSSCSYCKEYNPIVGKLTQNLGLKYDVVKTDYLNETELKKLLLQSKVDIEEFGTPTTVVLKNGVPVGNHIGYMNESDLLSFLKETKLVDVDTEIEEEGLIEIGYSKYEEVLKKKSSVVVIGQTNCSHCTKAKPYYKEIAEENNIVIYYLDFTKLSGSEQNKLMTSNNYFIENPEFGTPTMLVVKSGKVTNKEQGFRSKDTTTSFLRMEGIIK